MVPAIGAALPRLDSPLVDRATGLAPAGPAGSASAVGQTQDFASVLSDVARDAITTMREAETVSIQGVKGEASTQAVVEAVMAAERTLQTAVAIRDKVTSAYLDLSRMAI